MAESALREFDPKRVKAVLFDLDGTLLNVDMHRFIPAYLARLAGHFSDLVTPELFTRTMLATISALIAANDGRLNAESVAEVLERRLGVTPTESAERYQKFYSDGLSELQPLVEPLSQARKLLTSCVERGLSVIIATNPVFPREVVEARLNWGGIGDLPYALVTTLENCHYCKPHPEYFIQVLAQLGLSANQTVMVGNDTEHDLAARTVGIPAFLVDPWMIERNGDNYTYDWRGDHHALETFLLTLGNETNGNL